MKRVKVYLRGMCRRKGFIVYTMHWALSAVAAVKYARVINATQTSVLSVVNSLLAPSVDESSAPTALRANQCNQSYLIFCLCGLCEIEECDDCEKSICD